MRFVFSRRFYILLFLGIFPLSISWQMPMIRTGVLLFDVALIALALVDFLISRRLPAEFTVERSFDKRFAIGSVTNVTLHIDNRSERDLQIITKDEFPPEMTLTDSREARFFSRAQTSADFTYSLTPPGRGAFDFGFTAVRFRSRLGLLWCQTDAGKPQTVKVYPNMERAREMELKALGSRSFLATNRKSVRRGEGREFESMRDYVRGDELRHISWTATARRSRLITRQYQIERDQSVVIALDAGRLMTGRIGNETKFDTAIHASIALMSACAKAGDNCGLAVFGRRVNKYIPPKRGMQHIDAVLEALHNIQPELIEPSYSRAFQFISTNSKKRTFVVILTDLVDRDSSKELIRSLRLLRPQHLPMVVTIGDRDLNSVVSQSPQNIKEVFTQSAAEEIIHQRAAALRMVESLGGLAIDVTTQTLGTELLQNYIRVKERGLL